MYKFTLMNQYLLLLITWVKAIAAVRVARIKARALIKDLKFSRHPSLLSCSPESIVHFFSPMTPALFMQQLNGISFGIFPVTFDNGLIQSLGSLVPQQANWNNF